MKQNGWVRLLTYITGLVNQELLLQNEYLAAKNRILRAQLPARLRLSDPESHARRGRQTTRAQGTGPGSLRGQAGHHSGLVPQADRAQVRRIQTPVQSRQAANRPEGGSAHCPVCDSDSPVSRFFQARLVATDNQVKVLSLRAVRVSASRPARDHDAIVVHKRFSFVLSRLLSGHASRRAQGALLTRPRL